MAYDVPDWLDTLSGAALGINKGATLAADPYKAWDAVQKTGLENRNLEGEQLAREALPDYYGHRATAADTATQLATSKGLSDIYGTDTALAMQKALGPGSAFQAEIQARGLTPDMPEYMLAAQKYIGQYNPQAGIAAESLFKIPETQNRNTMDQLNTAYVQAYARRADPNAIAVRQPDGTFVIHGSQGETIPVNVDQLAKIVSFMKTSDPSQVMNAALTTQGAIQKTNAEMVTALANWQKALNTGVQTPAQANAALNSLRVGLDKELARIAAARNFVLKSDDFKFAKTQEEKDAMLAPFVQQEVAARETHRRAMTLLEQRANAIGYPLRQGMGAGNAVVGMGGSSVDARPFTSIVDAVRAAAGLRSPPAGAVAAPPNAAPPAAPTDPLSALWGTSSAAPPYPVLGPMQQSPTAPSATIPTPFDLSAPASFGSPQGGDLYNFNSPEPQAAGGLDQYLAALLGGQA